MQRWMLVIAGLLLIGAAALGWMAENQGTQGEDENSGSLASGADRTNPGQADETLDPLVPPIELAGSHRTLPGATTIRSIAGEPKLLSPTQNLIERIEWDSDFSTDLRASFHAHGEQICASGCAASRHPTQELTKATYYQLLKEYQNGPIDETNLALETLLYFGRQTKQMLASEGTYPLDKPRIEFLQQQLEIEHAEIEIRLVDEFGDIRTWIPPTRVPFDRRHVFKMEVERLQPLVTSGTVKRVGLYHLWTRL